MVASQGFPVSGGKGVGCDVGCVGRLLPPPQAERLVAIANAGRNP
jgi:hypothetical protein